MESYSVKIVEAGAKKTWKAYFLAVLQNSGLIVTLAKRDIKVKYAQSMLGVFWVLIQPIVGVALFTLVIGNWLKLPDIAYPYPLFAFSGVIGWNFFSYMVTAGGISLSESRELIHRLSFPRIILPVSKVLVGLFDLMIAMLVLLIVLPFAGIAFSWSVIFIPVFVLLLMLTGWSLAVWLSALTIRFRDFHHIIPYIVNFGIWLTPVFYPMAVVPEKFSFIMQFNPVAFAIEGLRWSLFSSPFHPTDFAPSLILIIILLLSGLFYFRSVEKEIPDTI